MNLLMPDFKTEIIQGRQDAKNIARQIKRAIYNSTKQADIIADKFIGRNDVETCKKVFLFIRKNIEYKRESSNLQTSRTVARILYDKKGDCKHYTILACSILRSLNIPCKMRLISQNFYNTEPTHIYCVAKIKNEEIIIDPCLKNFNTEASYKYKYDIKF
jgi:hypothetical protein